MKLKDEKVYEDWKSKNTDSYGAGIFRYAEGWANLMEQEIEAGKQLQDIAGELSHKADTEGITGFMYGAAVNILSQCWEHGEDLRKWHNGEFNYNGDGVVNPAILTIKTKDETNSPSVSTRSCGLGDNSSESETKSPSVSTVNKTGKIHKRNE